MQTICNEYKLYAILVGIIGCLWELQCSLSLDVIAIRSKCSLCLQTCRSQYLSLLFPYILNTERCHVGTIVWVYICVHTVDICHRI